MGRRPKTRTGLDRELSDLPREMRWRTFMHRVEAVIFASAEPVSREVLSSLVASDIVLDDLIADIREELKSRPYDIASVGGGYQFRTRLAFADAISSLSQFALPRPTLSKTELLALTIVAYLQPVTRGRMSELLGRDVSRDIIAALRDEGLIANGPRSPEQGAPFTYVTTKSFLTRYGFDSLHDLPVVEEDELLKQSPRGGDEEEFGAWTYDDEADENEVSSLETADTHMEEKHFDIDEDLLWALPSNKDWES